MQKAVRLTEEIWSETAKFIKAGVTEKEIADFMHSEIKRRELGFGWEPSSCPAVFAGFGIAEAHFAPGEKKVKRGEVVNIDFGVRYNGYVSDMQRMFYVLEENETSAPDDVMRGFNTIVEAIEKSKQAMKKGVQAFEIDAIARKIIVDKGYDEFPHGLGHQLGKFSHDGTALLGPKWEKYANKPFMLLEENMVFTIEPRLKVPNRGIVSIEEMVVVKENSAEWLTVPQKEIILIK